MIQLNKERKRKLVEFSDENQIEFDSLEYEYFIVKILEAFNEIERWEWFVLKWWAALVLFYDILRTTKDVDVDLSFWLNLKLLTEQERLDFVYNTFTMLHAKDKNFSSKNEMFFSKMFWTLNGFYKFWNKKIKFDIKINKFSQWEQRKLSNLKSNLFLDWKELFFNCIPESLVFASKIIAFWWRTQGKDCYDIFQMCRKNFFIDLDYLNKEIVKIKERVWEKNLLSWNYKNLFELREDLTTIFYQNTRFEKEYFFNSLNLNLYKKNKFPSIEIFKNAFVATLDDYFNRANYLPNPETKENENKLKITYKNQETKEFLQFESNKQNIVNPFYLAQQYIKNKKEFLKHCVTID